MDEATSVIVGNRRATMPRRPRNKLRCLLLLTHHAVAMLRPRRKPSDGRGRRDLVAVRARSVGELPIGIDLAGRGEMGARGKSDQLFFFATLV